MFGSKVNTATPVNPPHPFYPLEANVIGYLANKNSVIELLGIFAVACLTLAGVTLAAVNSYNPRLPGVEKTLVVWFVLTGSIHLFFEGYFAYNHANMPGRQDIFGQLWKEYSNSDSRYMTSDPFVLCMETVTAVFWGPLSFFVAYLITTDSPLRHPFQAVVSLGQLYGDVLYYATSMFDLYYKGLAYCRPEAYYFWFYYFFMNIIWIIIPSILLSSSIRESAKAFQALNGKSGSRRQANGRAKKSQ